MLSRAYGAGGVARAKRTRHGACKRDEACLTQNHPRDGAQVVRALPGSRYAIE
jgi:hypothetical protein